MTTKYAWIGLLTAAGLQLLGAELGETAAARNCQADADCGGAPATCELTPYETCAGKDPACPAGSSCGDKPTMPNQPGCSTYLEGICRQPHELPCRVDADCGVGFRCAEQIGMWCAGMGSSGSPGTAPTWSQQCGVSRGTFACALIETHCKVDRDCAAGLRCQQSEASACDAPSGTADTGSDAPVLRADCSESELLLCAPRGYFNFGAGDVTAEGAADNANGGAAGASADEALADERSAVAGGGGCSVHAVARTTWTDLGWLALLGMVAVRRGRRVGE